MEISDALDFVRRRQHGILITQKADGRPQSSNIAYVVDEDRIVISVTDGRAKTANLRRTPRASLHVNRDDFWAYAVVEADVDVSPVAADPSDETVERLVEYYRSVAGEHDDWDDYRRAMVADSRLVLTLTPTHAYGIIAR
ncbi:PPOX class F420-dependent oxidoreductase [Ilumatobacter nonamiensis]|uniref:PPOX class F420-dependent oxidoreductase n=1 Tax=Ilumatobacter nonamiensis TaxID=467093 RepID=UPI00058AE9E9